MNHRNNKGASLPIAKKEREDILYLEEGKKQVPQTFRMGREVHLQFAKVKRDLFTDLEEQESGNIIVSGLDKVSKTDFMAFGIAVTQVLYNQSYLSGNLQTNSGKSKTIAKKLSNTMGVDMYVGDIEVSLKDLCRYGYGEIEPTSKQKKTMASLIDTLHSTPVVVTYPNGDTSENILCAKMGKYTRAKDKAIVYNLHLAPIFCCNVVKNFGELPQNIIKRIKDSSKRITEAHYVLAELLGIQKKGSTFTRYIEKLVDELGLTDVYKAQRTRTEKQLVTLFDTMEKVGLIIQHTEEYDILRGKKYMSKVTFQIATRTKMLEAAKE